AGGWGCLRWAGHGRGRVLAGGLEAWVRAGLPLEEGDVAPVPDDAVVAQHGCMPTVTAEQLERGEATRLLDARAPERFRGEHEPVDPVAGHIPGAVSCPTTALLGPDVCFLPPERLRVHLWLVLPLCVANSGSGQH